MKMVTGIKSIILLILSLILQDCKERPLSKHDPEVIDLESNIKNFQEIKLSQFNAQIIYLPLRKDENLEISYISNIDVTSDMILISNSDLCLLFDHNGKIIKKIGDKGRGPNEYSAIVNSSFGFNNNLYVQFLGNILEYKLDGSFINSFDIKKDKDPLFYMCSWTVLNDSIFFGQVPLPSRGNGKIKAILFDKFGRTKQEYENYILLERPRSGFSSSEDSQASFYRFNGNLYFKEMMNDTLFWLTQDYSLSPRITFNIGKYCKPKEYRQQGHSESSNPFNFVYLRNVFEISNFLFLDCSFGVHSPAKRLTPREYMGMQIWVNTSNVLGIYNKENKSLRFSLPSSTDNSLFTTGFYNDIDAGPRFYPIKQFNDSTMVMWIEAKHLKDHIASSDFRNSEPIYPEKKRLLEEMTKNISELDNPILMFVVFKKHND
jgi:hypothetical protein